MSNNVYAIYNSSGSAVVSGYGNKTEAWDDFLEHKNETYYSFERAAIIARYRRDGYYCGLYNDTVVRMTTQPKADTAIYLKYKGEEFVLDHDLLHEIEQYYNGSNSMYGESDLDFDAFLKAIKIAFLVANDDL